MLYKSAAHRPATLTCKNCRGLLPAIAFGIYTEQPGVKNREVKAVHVCKRGDLQQLLPKISKIYFGELVCRMSD